LTFDPGTSIIKPSKGADLNDRVSEVDSRAEPAMGE
jgi:hypothetical protein